ncbi:DUF6299 family protein [Amycolatopsis minnesotensis]|uniref:DUF6299 family protein n=1 Tax=Amycolatopsis minnesotensis TaxID=337894 RepID=A0ABP5DGQ8_9PSEU
MPVRFATFAATVVVASIFAATPASAASDTVTITASEPLTNATTTISGTYRCEAAVAPRVVFVSTSLSQHGLSRSIGNGTLATCDGQEHSYLTSQQFTESPFRSGPVTATSTLLSLPTKGLPVPGFLATATRILTWGQ